MYKEKMVVNDPIAYEAIFKEKITIDNKMLMKSNSEKLRTYN